MKTTYITLILMSLLICPIMVQADSAPLVVQPEAAPPANMGDEALASYISGRLKEALRDENYEVSQTCDATGCSVVVQ